MADIAQWYQIKATGPSARLDELCAVMSTVDAALMIEDTSDLETRLDGVYGDLIDEEVLNADRTVASVSVFVPAERYYGDILAFLRQLFGDAGLDASLTVSGVNEEDWADSWKKYYKPIPVGDRLVIVPAWEFDEYKAAHGGGAALVSLDPGMAFGTGTHETTRLCAGLLAEIVKPGDRVLDVGCGSGILAICAAKLGASYAFACDIDAVAVRVARENAELNSVSDVVETGESNLLQSAKAVDGGYDIVCANIVADIIIRLAPDVGAFLSEDGAFIASGIIDERADDVRAALGEAGISVVREERDNGWTAFLCAHTRNVG